MLKHRIKTHGVVLAIAIAALWTGLLQGCDAPAKIVTDSAKVNMDQRTKELQDARFGMFICWSFSTFSGYEWTPGVEDINFFNPTGFDPDQWCRTAKEAGMGYILFLTKHHDGFCLWDTQTTDRKVPNTKALRGVDVLKEVRKACDKHGLKLALYFSEGDWSWNPKNKGIHKSVPRPKIKKAQLKELLTQYGPIEYIWFDHAVNDGGLSHAETAKFCKALQPGCFVGFNHGTAAGDLMLRERGRPGKLTDPKTVWHNQHHAKYKGFRLAEFTYPILEGQGRRRMRGAQWFYSLPENDNRCASAEKIYHDYLGAKKYGNIFSLDVGPDRSGKLRKIDVKTLRKVGQYIRGEIKLPAEASPAKPTASTKRPIKASSQWDKSYSAAKANDGNKTTRWGAKDGSTSGWLEVDLGSVKNIHLMAVNEYNNRTKSYRLQYRSKPSGPWKTATAGKTLGNNARKTFKPVKGRHFRLEIIKASGVPSIYEWQLQ